MEVGLMAPLYVRLAEVAQAGLCKRSYEDATSSSNSTLLTAPLAGIDSMTRIVLRCHAPFESYHRVREHEGTPVSNMGL